MPLDAALTADRQARITALSSIDRTLLVEAGAGSGKTSVLAGRVVVLLASGRHPSSIAAISFTEFSAAELRERITRFIERVLKNDVPADLRDAFPATGLTAEQRVNLEAACRDLDCLECNTIHGFCQVLLRPYPVEAGIDPGAAILNGDEADLLFEDEVTDWIRDRLSEQQQSDDLFSRLYLIDPRRTSELLRELTKALRLRRDAQVAPPPDIAAMITAVRAEADGFRSFLASLPAGKQPEPLVGVSDAIAAHLAAAPIGNEADLIAWAVYLKAPKGFGTKEGVLNAASKVCSKKVWQQVFGAGKGTAATVDEMRDRSAQHYNACRDGFEAVRVAAAAHVLSATADEARDILRRYDKAKQAAARLDFDDLLEKTRLLLRNRPEVRAELGQRFTAVLVDEFQDTDPVQLEILWRLCGEPPKGVPSAPIEDWRLRPGSLFLVGDPKQSIFRFRGADLNAFVRARNMLESADPACILPISRNFRSRPLILEWVNERFKDCLDAVGQCGFAELLPDATDALDMPSVAAVDLDCKDTTASGVRDTEADEVAKLCLRLVGSITIRDRDAEGGTRLCEARDIALLVPTNSDLWRYERALEDNGFTVATQAGKGFYRRQEVQDLIALTRTLVNRRDRLALGALLRGPLIGFPDEALLDAVGSQPVKLDKDGRRLLPQLSLDMDFSVVPDARLREVLETLKSLERRRLRTTPHALLCRAVEELKIRAKLRQRGNRVAELALANVDLFLEMARAYDVRGLLSFADRMRARWEEAEKAPDARPDADLRSISLVTMHSGKGLEWPVVIPVNTATEIQTNCKIAYDSVHNRLHMPVFGISPDGCEAAIEEEKRQQKFERERLWYVAATRPRDLLMIPRLVDGAATNSWIRLVELGLEALDPFGDDLPAATIPLPPEVLNQQTEAVFAEEADRIMAAVPLLRRSTPHLSEGDETGDAPLLVSEEIAGSVSLPTRGGLARGVVLHKLLEEVLTGETPEERDAMVVRTAELLAQTPLPIEGFDPAEIADTALRGLGVPEVAAVRNCLQPEWPVARAEALDGVEIVTLGVADAVALAPDGSCSLVVDWKSDVAPSERTIARYRGQLAEYLATTRSPHGILVFVSTTPPLVVPVNL